MWEVLAVCVVALGLGGSAHSRPVSLSGKVMDEAGKPVASAQVWARTPQAGQRPTTQTDQAGSFRLEFEVGRRDGWQVLAVAPGLAVGATEYVTASPGPIGLKLAPESQIHGRVVGPDDRPVPAAEVVLRELWSVEPKPLQFSDLLFVGQLGDSPVRCRTDADGRFTLSHVPKGKAADLVVSAPSFAYARPFDGRDATKPPVGGEAGECVIHLDPAAVIEGTVRHQGKPAAGVGVSAQAAGAGSGWDKAVTDADGHYRLEHLSAGAYNVELDDLSRLVAPAQEKVAAESSATVSGIDFDLTEGGFVEGRVVDADTGQPIADTRVAGYGPMRPRSSGWCFGTETDEQGRYRVRVAPGRNYLYYQGGTEGYPFSEKKASFEIEVGEGQTVQAPDLRLTAVPPLEVLALMPDGRPLAGATVRAMVGWPFEGTTDADGRCLLRDLEPDRPVLVLAQDRGLGLCGLTTVAPEQRGRPVAVRLAVAAEAEFRLVDPKLRPLPAIRVTACVDPPEGDWSWVEGATDVGKAVSDARGIVRFEGLPPGGMIWYSIEERVSKPVEWPKSAVLAPAQVQQLGDITVDLTMADVSGIVVFPDQTPVRGAKVWADEWHGQLARTDEAGRFTLRNLPAATRTTVVANSPDGKLWGVEQLVPEWEYEPGIVLHPAVRVTARLVDVVGKPLARASAILSSNVFIGDTVARHEATTDEQGRLSLTGVIPGLTYDLLVARPQPPDTLRSVREVTPAGGADCDLGDITVPDG